MSIPLALCASNIEDNQIQNKKINKIKKDTFHSDKINTMKNAIRSIHRKSTESVEEPFSNFNPIHEPDKPVQTDKYVSEYQYNKIEAPHMPLMQAYQSEPKYSSPTSDQTIILEKLDKIIHLFEETNEGKSNQKVEEIILYSFLRVFIIYVLDSFARIGKYVR